MAEAYTDDAPVIRNTFENHQQQRTLCGTIFSCFKSRARRCNSDPEACRRCSTNRRPRSRPVIRSSRGDLDPRVRSGMAIPSTSSEESPQSPSSPEDGACKRARRQSEPSAPSPGLVLFNCEDQSDVVFLVGRKPDQWRFPGHSFIIAEASPVFDSIIALGKRSSGMSTGDRVAPSDIQHPVLSAETKDVCQILVSDTPPDVFENVLSFVYKRDVPPLTVPRALSLLKAAIHFQLSDLGRACLDFLSDNVKEDTVLEILPQLQRRRDNPNHCHQNLPSPVSDELCTNSRNEVLLRCFDVIDDCAESVLRQEQFERLSYESLIEILSRDTLRVNTEMTVFEAATRWACQECKRRQMELLPENKREVLGKVLYMIRYLAMSPEEFQRGPVVSNVLEENEKNALMARLKGDFSTPLPDNLVGRKLDSRRPGPRSGLSSCTGAVAKVPTSAKRPLGRSCSFTSGTSSSDRSSSRRNRHSANGDPKKSSTSKKFFRGLGDIVICLVQMLD